jgi:ABC-2 type transport system permease protein
MTGSAWTVAWLTWRQLFARRRAWLAAAIAVFPFLMTFIYRLSSEDNEGDRIVFMMGMNRELLLGVLLPLAALIFGTTSFGGEVEDGTLVYLLVKPVRRWRVVLVKYLVALVVTIAVVSVAVLLPWWALRNEELPLVFIRGFLVAVAVGAAIYCAVFTLLGLVTRRGLLFGLLYVIFIEQVLTRNFDGVASLSARELAISVAQWAGGGVVKWPTPAVAMPTVWTVAGLAVAAAIAITMRRLARYELAEKI